MRKKPNENFLVILSIILSFFGILYLYEKNFHTTKVKKIYKNQPVKKEYILINNNIKRVEDNQYNDNMDGPGRDFYSKRINIRTRGQPDEYQTVGILKESTSGEVLPLMGRRTYPGSNHWNYFTMTDSHLKTEIPVKINNKNCTDDIGCSEIQSKETISLFNKNYDVELYPYNKLRYIPYI
tara:strand:- start:84 stop:626 length:543 start_codon:yes stop_codon:yes gene_type:complete